MFLLLLFIVGFNVLVANCSLSSLNCLLSINSILFDFNRMQNMAQQLVSQLVIEQPRYWLLHQDILNLKISTAPAIFSPSSTGREGS